MFKIAYEENSMNETNETVTEKFEKELSELANELYLKESLADTSKRILNKINEINDSQTIIKINTARIWQLKDEIKDDMERKRGYEEQLKSINEAL